MAMNALSKTHAKGVALPFQWRDRLGGLHAPADMETRHLFHTVSMIWNHVMPPEAVTHQFRPYAFSAFYTADYMRSAVRAMLPELLGRDDLTPAWRRRIEFMRGWLFAQEGIEIAAIRAPLKALPGGAS